MAVEWEPDELDVTTVAAQARLRGDARRGALVFFKSAAACNKCHGLGENSTPLGPDLSTIAKDATDEFIAESILQPSKTIRKGYETVRVATDDGRIVSGLIASDTGEQLVLRDAANLQQDVTIEKSAIEEIATNEQSMMPQGLAATLSSKQDLYDLVRYVGEVARGGKARAAALHPDPEDLIVRDDTINLDHAGILRSLGAEDFAAGKRVYLNHCKNCHGYDGNTPTLATARAFGRQPMRYGGNPYQMLATLTKGAGLMTPMQHLSPKERYQVIHYIREGLMKPSNPAYREIDETFLSQLPKGTGQGEVVLSSEDRDFGPVLGSQLGQSVNNALTFRLPGDVAVSYDLHRMRMAGAWTGGFLNLSETQHYRQRGERMPEIDGERIPGLGAWQWAFDGSFEISEDDKPARGPVRDDWLQYFGHYLHGNQAILSYGIEGRKVLETVQSERLNDQLILRHTLRVDAGDQPLKLSVARLNMEDGPVGLVAADGQLTGRSGSAGGNIAIVSGEVDDQPQAPRMKNQAWHVVAGKKAADLDLGTAGRTILVRFRTNGTGTLVASAPRKGRWAPNGKTLFIRGDRLVFDIGWLGAITGKSNVRDGKWHVAAVVVSDKETLLYVDGRLEGKRADFRREYEGQHVLKIGATATNFGGDFDGEIDWVRMIDQELPVRMISRAFEVGQLNERPIFEWSPEDATKKPPMRAQETMTMAAAMVAGDSEGMTWEVEQDGRMVLSIPASNEPRSFEIHRAATTVRSRQELCDTLRKSSQSEVIDLATWTQGGPLRWPQRLEVVGELGESINGYALDTIPVPFENPWNAWMRTSALDFFNDGRAVVTTHGGDVYIVSGIGQSLSKVTWKRFAAGLFEPFGVRVLNGKIYVTCRDGLKRLHDFNGDGEADFVEAFWNDDDVSNRFHAYNFDLQTDSQGNFYLAKAGQYTQHHRPGTIMRIPSYGGRAEVVAWGIRTPNGMGKLDDDRFTVSDNQGPWMPAGKISLIRPGSFLGNMPINKEQDAWLKAKHGGQLPQTFDEPIIWTPQELDNSSGGQVWVDDPRFGPLSGRLLHSSFGKGWIYYLSLQEVDQYMQASIVAMPHQWDAGVMRLRVNPADGQLYGTGLSGWQGPKDGKDGCLQRLRYTGELVQMIEDVQVTAEGFEITFTFDVDPVSATDAKSWRGQMWNYLWSRRYGSDQFSVLNPGEKGRDELTIESVSLPEPNKVLLKIPNLRTCDQALIEVNVKTKSGMRYVEKFYATVHAIP